MPVTIELDITADSDWALAAIASTIEQTLDTQLVGPGRFGFATTLYRSEVITWLTPLAGVIDATLARFRFTEDAPDAAPRDELVPAVRRDHPDRQRSERGRPRFGLVPTADGPLMSAQLVTRYESARGSLTAALRAEPALAQYIGDDDSDWIFALCDAWGALAEVIGFYQCRILDEAFLSTATQDSSEELIYHSLGHIFPPNATATTTLAYHLQSSVAGVEAVSRLGVGRGHGDEPADDRPAEHGDRVR